MANQFLAFALFVMLLSFFIILNSMSNFEIVKAREVLSSISVAFSTEAVPEELSPNIAADPVESAQEGSTLDKLKSLFETQISGVDVKKNRLGTTMHLRMDLDLFDQQFSSKNSLAAGELTPTLVSLLGAEDEVPYSMEMLINLADNPAAIQNDDPEEVTKNIRRVSGYAQAIEEIGLPKKYLSAGLGSGPAGTIDLFFRRYQPFNPLGARAE